MRNSCTTYIKKFTYMAIFFQELTVKSTHPFQDFFTVVLICKEERDFPAGVTVDSIDLSRKN